jgi:SAM-dependent methyltransferase
MLWLLTALTLSVVGACVSAGKVSTADAPTKTTAAPAVGAKQLRATLATASTSEPVPTIAESSPTPEVTPVAPTPPVTSAAPATPVMPDIDYWATPQPVVDKMLELAQVKQSDVVYDLGCGDARSLVTAATRYGARGVGIDIDPRVVALARDNVRSNGVEHLVTIEQANIFTLDLSPADVIFLYITQRFNLRLVPQFKRMRKGSRIVAHEFEIPGARPVQILHVPGPPDGPPDADQRDTTVLHTIFLWRLPWQKQWTDWK